MNGLMSTSKERQRVFFWGSLGPFFLANTLLISCFKLQPESFWKLGILASFALGALITYLCLQEITALFFAQNSQSVSTSEDPLPLSNEIAQPEEVSHDLPKVIVQCDCSARFASELEKKEETILWQGQKITALVTLVNEMESHQSKVEVLSVANEKESARLLKELNTLHVEHFQAVLLCDSQKLTCQIQEEKIKALKQELERYIQTKQQFLQKSQTLSETRRELFLLETKWLALHKEQEQEGLSQNAYETALIQELQEMQKTCDDLEAEVEHLQAFISEILNKKPATRAKKMKKSATLQEVLLPLDDLLNNIHE